MVKGEVGKKQMREGELRLWGDRKDDILCMIGRL
jgi:hypothetical protein